MLNNPHRGDLFSLFKDTLFILLTSALLISLFSLYSYLFLDLTFGEAFKPTYFAALVLAVVFDLISFGNAIKSALSSRFVKDKLSYLFLGLIFLVPVVLIVFSIAPVAGLVISAIVFVVTTDMFAMFCIMLVRYIWPLQCRGVF